MKQINFLFLAICLIAEVFLCAQDQTSNSWLEDWVNAIELSKDYHTCPRAIENYTSAIQALNPSQAVFLLNLMNERGNLYFKTMEFSNAIKDFSFVLNHSQVNQEQKIEALWGRSKAYLASGKVREFQEDCKQLEQLEASFTPIEDNKDYAIFKLPLYMLREDKGRERFVRVLMIQKEIKSEKDAIFTPSGLVIVKKDRVE